MDDCTHEGRGALDPCEVEIIIKQWRDLLAERENTILCLLEACELLMGENQKLREEKGALTP